MKKILFIGCFILSIASCKAQQAIPVENQINYINNNINIPDGAYFKDVNNVLNKYIGEWKGSISNKNYTFIVDKFTHSFLGISVDKLLIRYKITNQAGTVIEDTTALTNASKYVIKGQYLDAAYVLFYQGREFKCGQKGNVFISVYENNTKMQLFLVPDSDLIGTDDCPNGEASQLLPTDSIILVKQ